MAEPDEWEDWANWDNFEPVRLPKPEDGDIAPSEVDRTVNKYTLEQGAVYEWNGEKFRASTHYGRWELYRKQDGEKFYVLLDRRIIDKNGRFVGEIDDLGEPIWIPNRKPRTSTRGETIPLPPPVQRKRERISSQQEDIIMILENVSRMETSKLLRAVYNTDRPTKTQRAAFSRTLRKMVDYGYILLTQGNLHSGHGKTAILRMDNKDLVKRIAQKRTNR
jgi:hypothetical protein